MPTLDYGDDCPPHLKMIMNNGLGLYGYDAQVFRPLVIDNIYETFAPETTVSLTPMGKIKIFTSQPIEGFMLSDYIRLTDVTTEITITTLAKLEKDDQVVITTPDNYTFNMRITESLAFSTMSKVRYKFKAVQC